MSADWQPKSKVIGALQLPGLKLLSMSPGHRVGCQCLEARIRCSRLLAQVVEGQEHACRLAAAYHGG